MCVRPDLIYWMIRGWLVGSKLHSEACCQQGTQRQVFGQPGFGVGGVRNRAFPTLENSSARGLGK